MLVNSRLQKNEKCFVVRHEVQPLMYMCRDALEDVPSVPLFVHLAYQCSFLFVCFVGLYAGHPYIHLISFEIFLLACYICNILHTLRATSVLLVSEIVYYQ